MSNFFFLKKHFFGRDKKSILFCVINFVKKGSFLAKTAVSRWPYGFSIVFPFIIYLFS